MEFIVTVSVTVTQVEAVVIEADSPEAAVKQAKEQAVQFRHDVCKHCCVVGNHHVSDTVAYTVVTEESDWETSGTVGGAR